MTGNGFPDDLDYGQTIQIPRFGPTQKIFRRYTLQKILGRGGMGVVWLARDDQLETLVALKVLPEALCHDHASLQALKHETKLGLRLAHPNIVRIYDFQQDDDAAAISMEYVDGVTLSDVRVARPEKVFSPSDLQPYIAALSDALNYAHTRRKIVHRDLKPRNLMLNSEGELKIADFGISRSISESMIMVTGKLGGSTGSPPYISPQQWDGDPPTALDDIYSVGATLYELLTSKPPLLGVVDWQQVHSNIPPPMWRRRNDLGITGVADIPPEWEETIAACLAKDPKDRPQTIVELQARLANHISEEAVDHVTEQAFDDTIVIPRTPSAPKLEVPAAPLIDPQVTMPAPLPSEPKQELSPATAPAAPALDAKLTMPPPAPSEPKEQPVAANVTSTKIEKLTVEAKREPPPSPEVTPQSPIAPAPESDSITSRPSSPAPETPPTLREEVVPKIVSQPSAELDSIPAPASSPPKAVAAALAQEVLPETATQPAAELNSISVPAHSASDEAAATPPEEFFVETATQPVPQPEASYPSRERMPRWIWATVGIAIFLLGGSFFVLRKPSPRAVTPSHIEKTNIQSTPSITGFTLDIDSVGRSADGKQVFPKHVTAFVNNTAAKVQANGNHWSVDFEGKMPPLPFDLEVSAPGYQPAVLHFEHIDDLKNANPLRLDREHGNVAFPPNRASQFTAAQLKMVEALPGQSEDVVVDSSTISHDLNTATPAALATGVYEVAFQSGNRKATTAPVRVAVQAGAVQLVDLPKPPTVTAKPTPHPTNPTAAVATTNEMLPPVTPPAVSGASDTPAPMPVIASPTVAIAKEISSPASTPPLAIIAASPANTPPGLTPVPKENASPANVPATPAYAKESPGPQTPSPAAAETPQPRMSERAAKLAERKPKKAAEPTRAKVATRSPAASPKASNTPVRKKASQAFEGGVPGG